MVVRHGVMAGNMASRGVMSRMVAIVMSLAAMGKLGRAIGVHIGSAPMRPLVGFDLAALGVAEMALAVLAADGADAVAGRKLEDTRIAYLGFSACGLVAFVMLRLLSVVTCSAHSLFVLAF